ncbi:GspH/FimT family pseudopilin [Microbulbifer sp. TRSA002]|uniref:GspH/FimT family pseudopilin n=1 Tax=Microbulbifer sp. TRSA002 TaxID=3243382 RepID=UPI004039364A
MTHRGFTLLELLITLCILSILLFIGLPSFTQIIEKTQLKLAGEEIISAIQLTRNTAVVKNQRVTMRNSGGWDLGWEVFIDTDNDGFRGERDTLVMSGPKLDKVKVLSNFPLRDYISFIGTGESRKAGSLQGALQMGSLYVCSLDGSEGLALILFHSGRLRVEQANQSQCS